MPNFQDNLDLIVEVLRHNPKQSVNVQGAPGNGKTSLIHAAAKRLEIPDSNVVIFRPSLHDPVDLVGTPWLIDGSTHWASPAWLNKLREGRWMLGLDELPQGVVMMQNALAGLILDRVIGEVTLSPDVYIISTGNRTTDKAGANRMVGQLANRVLNLDMESSLSGWTEWALDAGMPIWLISFLRFRPNLLNDYSPDRFSNPTERTWEMVGRLPPTLTGSGFFNAVKGLVGEGAAAEVVGFKEIMCKMPNVDTLLLSPGDAPVPTDPATLYALSGALAHRAGKDNFDRVTVYADRMPPEFSVLLVRDAYKLKPEISGTAAFTKWAMQNSGVLI